MAGPMVAAALFLASCGDDGPTAASEPTRPVAPETAAAPQTTARPLNVRIVDFEYTPKRATVPVGTEVTWKNTDTSNHTVTFDESGKDLGNQPPGASKRFTFAKAGEFAYHCDFHPNMHGTVVVR
jgi:plastocyanin